MSKKTNRPKTSARLSENTPGQFTGLDRVVNEAEAATIIGYSKDTLRREFRAGNAPARIRLSGRRIGYRLSDIYAWLDAHTEVPGARAA